MRAAQEAQAGVGAEVAVVQGAVRRLQQVQSFPRVQQIGFEVADARIRVEVFVVGGRVREG